MNLQVTQAFLHLNSLVYQLGHYLSSYTLLASLSDTD